MMQTAFGPKSGVDWESFQTRLADYVRLELEGQAADEVYPEIAFYIETSPQCETAYYREFRRQGLSKPVAELRQIGQRKQAAAAMRQILPLSDLEPELAPDPSWYEVVLKRGRGWLERETNHWRQLWLALPAMQVGPEAAPVLAGLLSADTAASASAGGALHIAPEGANFAVALSVLPDMTRDAENVCQLDVAVTLADHFGDFSGVSVALLWGDVVHKQTTDVVGKVSFSDLPCDRLPLMSLMVKLPD